MAARKNKEVDSGAPVFKNGSAFCSICRSILQKEAEMDEAVEDAEFRSEFCYKECEFAQQDAKTRQADPPKRTAAAGGLYKRIDGTFLQDTAS